MRSVPVRCSALRHPHRAAEGGDGVGDAPVVGGHDDLVHAARLPRALVDVRDHRLAAQIGECFSWEARGVVAGGDEGDDRGRSAASRVQRRDARQWTRRIIACGGGRRWSLVVRSFSRCSRTRAAGEPLVALSPVAVADRDAAEARRVLRYPSAAAELESGGDGRDRRDGARRLAGDAARAARASRRARPPRRGPRRPRCRSSTKPRGSRRASAPPPRSSSRTAIRFSFPAVAPARRTAAPEAQAARQPRPSCRRRPCSRSA